MKTAVFGRDSSVEAGSPCGAPPSLTFTPPAHLVPPTTSHHNRTSRAGISASSAQVVRHTRRTSRMQNKRSKFEAGYTQRKLEVLIFRDDVKLHDKCRSEKIRIYAQQIEESLETAPSDYQHA
ncbi:hypothetical protein WR25_10243 [Diploscapter pachys]|uniref:Uncharacterized protein n=1 Tax=Diploscapter pachys TaxID=2018661 RepID=A0A2A2KD92_9BILA|nr:hypothetical protein WR25_10243 [Diploscapter pachys]